MMVSVVVCLVGAAQPVALRSVRSKLRIANQSPNAQGMSGQGSQVNVRTLYNCVSMVRSVGSKPYCYVIRYGG